MMGRTSENTHTNCYIESGINVGRRGLSKKKGEGEENRASFEGLKFEK
jgi:hypothetical protein